MLPRHGARRADDDGGEDIDDRRASLTDLPKATPQAASEGDEFQKCRMPTSEEHVQIKSRTSDPLSTTQHVASRI